MTGRPKTGVTFWDRLYSRIEIDEEKGCWVYTGKLTKHGYARLQKGSKLVRAHRAVWERYKGAVPDGLFVCHKCDNRACVNIDHLFLGSNAANMMDMKLKGRGRGRRGHQHNMAKLTTEEVLFIRYKLEAGHSGASLARTFGMTPTQISNIKHRRHWKHV